MLRFLRPLAAALALALLPACDGNPTCVFVAGCGAMSTSGPGGNPATLPVDGQWIVDTRPKVEAVFPSGGGVHPTAPIVVVFSESMNEEALDGAIEVVPIGGNIIGSPLGGLTQVLLGGGRFLILIPSQPMVAGAYIVRLAGETAGGGGGSGGVPEESLPTDLTGQELDHVAGEQLGSSFTVPASPPAAPRVLTTWPAAGESGASDTPEVVVVLDRTVLAATVDDSSFRVTVDGADPVPDPAPAALVLEGGRTELRVFTWSSMDAAGNLVSLGPSADVDVVLSPSGSKISNAAGAELPDTRVSFRTIPFTTPLSAELLSKPTDAIGLRNLTPDGEEDLTIQVDLLDAEPGDFVDMYVFGTSTSEENPILVALRRELRLTGAAPIQVGTFSLARADITIAANSSRPRFADGTLSFAFRLRRGAALSPLRIMDVDPGLAGVQDPLLDTVRPTITRIGIPSGALGGGPSSTDQVSDVRDLVLAGVADEALESVEVTAVDGGTTMTNRLPPPADLPSVVGSRADGGFLAAPVPFGVLATGRATFMAVAYDLALNASQEVSGVFEQRGSVGPGAFLAGDTVRVEVFDERTLAPLRDALVLVHSDLGDGVSYPFVGSALTPASGVVSVATDPSAAAAIVTVDAAGYDLFTFHGVTSTRLSVPLPRSGSGPSSTVSGDVTSSDAAISQILGGLDRRLDDSRLARGSVRTYATKECINFFSFFCSYGPTPILPERLGLQSFFAGDFSLTETTFNPNQLLQAFCLELPTGPVASGAREDTSFELPFLLIDSSVDPEEKPDELTGFAFRADATTGIDTTALVDLDPSTTGLPGVTVEAIVPGVHSTAAVGLGLAFDQGTSMWNVRSARPGAVSPTGFFGSRAALDTDLFVRCELRDMAGNVAGVRPRLSRLTAPLVFAGTSVPKLTSPAAPPATTGARAYVVRFDDTVPDAAGQSGLYRVQLTDAVGRSHVLWTIDPPGSGVVGVRVPDAADGGGVGLANGSISSRISCYAWPDLDTAEFLWSDAERELELFSTSAPEEFLQGP